MPGHEVNRPELTTKAVPSWWVVVTVRCTVMEWDMAAGRRGHLTESRDANSVVAGRYGYSVTCVETCKDMRLNYYNPTYIMVQSTRVSSEQNEIILVSLHDGVLGAHRLKSSFCVHVRIKS